MWKRLSFNTHNLICNSTYPIVVLAGILVKLVQCNLGIQLICVRLEKDEESN